MCEWSLEKNCQGGCLTLEKAKFINTRQLGRKIMLNSTYEAEEIVAHPADQNTAFFAFNKKLFHGGLGSTKLIFIKRPSFDGDSASVLVPQHLLRVFASCSWNNAKRFAVSC